MRVQARNRRPYRPRQGAQVPTLAYPEAWLLKGLLAPCPGDPSSASVRPPKRPPALRPPCPTMGHPSPDPETPGALGAQGMGWGGPGLPLPGPRWRWTRGPPTGPRAATWGLQEGLQHVCVIARSLPCSHALRNAHPHTGAHMHRHMHTDSHALGTHAHRRRSSHTCTRMCTQLRTHRRTSHPPRKSDLDVLKCALFIEPQLSGPSPR